MLNLVVARTFPVISRRFSHAASATAKTPSTSLESFENTKRRIYGNGRSVEKILVTHKDGEGKSHQLLLNRNLSTAYDAAKRISPTLAVSCAVARATYVSGGTETLSPMSPLEQPCELEFFDFNQQKAENAEIVNKAFWNSAALLTATVISEALPGRTILPQNGLNPNDAFFSIVVEGDEWLPSTDDVKEFELRAKEIIASKTAFETIVVPESIAREEYGSEQSMILVKLNNYVYISEAPVIANTSQIGRIKFLQPVPLQTGGFVLGGVALPAFSASSTPLNVSSFNWELICDLAAKRFKSAQKQ